MRRALPTSWLLFCFVLAATSALSGHNPKPGDSKLMCLAAQSVLHHGSLAIEPVRVDVARSPNGQFYTKYPLLCVVQCVPALLLQSAARALAPQDPALELWLLGLVPHALSATLAVGVQLVALELGAGLGAAILLGLCAVFTTPLLVEGRVLYSENLQAVLGVYGIWAALRARDVTHRSAFAWGGVLCGLALNAKVLWLCLPLAIAVDQLQAGLDRKRILRLITLALPGFLLGCAAFIAYNQLRYGQPFAQGYDAERDGTLGFDVPLLSGLYGLLLSSGKSAFAYAPLLLVSTAALPRWWRTRRRDLILLAIPVLFTLLVSARWWAWSGDWAWGPRLIVPIIPLALLPALDALQRKSKPAYALALTGLCIQLLGTSIDPGHFLQVTHPATAALAGRQPPDQLRDDLLPVHFIPELNPITGQAWLLARYLGAASNAPWESLGIKAWLPHNDPTPKRLDYWLDLNSSSLAWTLELTCIGTSLILAWRVLRRARSTPS